MIVPIKFRGRVPDTNKLDGGRIVYGSLVYWNDGLFNSYWIRCYENGFFVEYKVDENSVAQLVGYSKDGREIYDGDIVVDGYGNEYTARVCAVYANDKFGCHFFDNGKISFTLKD